MALLAIILIFIFGLVMGYGMASEGLIVRFRNFKKEKEEKPLISKKERRRIFRQVGWRIDD
jgi:uncharacterized protein YneF (UPF0154 family)